MKQKLLLMMLTLGMCSTMGLAQKKEYKIGNDGFEWYEVVKVVNDHPKFGAEDRYGNMIVPTEYDFMYYSSNDNPLLTGFNPNKGKFMAWYSKSGKCIVPYTRGYTFIWKCDEDEFGTYYTFRKPDGGGILDRNGREVVSVKVDGLDGISILSTKLNKKTYYYLDLYIKKDGKEYNGIADATGKIIVIMEYKDYKDINTTLNVAKSRLTTTNPLADNRHETLTEAEGRSSSSSSTSSRTASSSSSNSNNNNSGSGTTTVVIEHQHTPQPMQEWQQCNVCYGDGKCHTYNCTNGWNYGTKTYCLGCGGNGRCHFCNGQGGRYITVYR